MSVLLWWMTRKLEFYGHEKGLSWSFSGLDLPKRAYFNVAGVKDLALSGLLDPLKTVGGHFELPGFFQTEIFASLRIVNTTMDTTNPHGNVGSRQSTTAMKLETIVEALNGHPICTYTSRLSAWDGVLGLPDVLYRLTDARYPNPVAARMIDKNWDTGMTQEQADLVMDKTVALFEAIYPTLEDDLLHGYGLQKRPGFFVEPAIAVSGAPPITKWDVLD